MLANHIFVVRKNHDSELELNLNKDFFNSQWHSFKKNVTLPENEANQAFWIDCKKGWLRNKVQIEFRKTKIWNKVIMKAFGCISFSVKSTD